MVGFKIGKLCPVQQVTHSTTRSPRRQDLELTETEWQQTNSNSDLLFYVFKYSVGSGYSDFLLYNPKPEPTIRFLIK